MIFGLVGYGFEVSGCARAGNLRELEAAAAQVPAEGRQPRGR